MKSLVLLAIVVLLGYFGYQRLSASGPVADPVYGEVRVDIRSGPREVEAAAFGRFSDAEDCRQRNQKFSAHLRDNCPECQIKSAECMATLAARYLKFFDDQPSHATYLSFNRSKPWERDVRLILWGLTGTEGDAVCEQMRQVLAKLISSPAQCIRGLAS